MDIKCIKVASPAEKVELNPKAKVSFQELFDEYAELKKQLNPELISFDTPHYRLSIIESTNPLVKEAYDKLGREEVVQLKYNQTNIRREILKKLDISTESKIFSRNQSLPISTYSNTERRY